MDEDVPSAWLCMAHGHPQWDTATATTTHHRALGTPASRPAPPQPLPLALPSPAPHSWEGLVLVHGCTALPALLLGVAVGRIGLCTATGAWGCSAGGLSLSPTTQPLSQLGNNPNEITALHTRRLRESLTTFW